MNSAENVKKLVKNAKIIINPENKKTALTELINVLRKSKAVDSTTNLSTGSIVMKSRITKLAAAAAIIIVFSTCLFLLKSTGSGIVLANVFKKLEQVAAYSYQIHTTKIRQQGSKGEFISTVLVSKDHGMKIIMNESDPSDHKGPLEETYVSPQQDSWMMFAHKHKMYFRLKFEDPELLDNDPQRIVEHFLNCDPISLGRSIIDRIAVEGFQSTIPNYKGGFMGISDMGDKNEKVEIKLWIDLEKSLPVRVEENIIKKNGTRFIEVSDTFRWNVAVDVNDFTPNIPDGYMSPIPEMIIPALNEQTAVKGLKVFSEIVGKYPSNLTGDTPIEEYKQFTNNDESTLENVSEDKRLNDIEMPIRGLQMFYAKLDEDKQDPVYYGNKFNLDDTDTVLLKWKLDDGLYRIIFGDLTIKTVMSEELAKLEVGKR